MNYALVICYLSDKTPLDIHCTPPVKIVSKFVARRTEILLSEWGGCFTFNIFIVFEKLSVFE